MAAESLPDDKRTERHVSLQDASERSFAGLLCRLLENPEAQTRMLMKV
ncbi:hypothetical protein [uncultured Gemmiger sp.]|nr:hypothetical protein [uncultured Gemmiger sp.]